MYLVFSVPDKTMHGFTDATNLEWYQPVQEPGNLFSYPWSYPQLAAQVPGGAMQLTANPTFLTTDGNAATQTTSWSASGTSSKSTGTVNSFAEGLGLSTSGVGTALGVKVNFNLSVNVNASQSFDSLNTSTQTLSASEGIAVNKPGFGGGIISYAQYSFGSYLLGNTPFADTFQKLSPESNGQPVDISSGGPLYLAYVASLSVAGQNPDPYWGQAYNLPDVGLNHPSRWQWNKSTGALVFNELGPQYHTDPENELFYRMKGFFISRVGDPPQSSNLTVANAGDKLQLSARVYNFSPIPTKSSADHIWVTFWGQGWDSVGNQLSGAPFLIGAAKIDSIPGFGSGDQDSDRNWVYASIPTPFDSTNYAGKYLVFWVTVFMANKDGDLVPELPGHGVTSNPSGVIYNDLTQFPTEAHGNNIGLYGVLSPLYIAQPNQPGFQGIESVSGPVTVAGVSLPSAGLLLGQRAPLSANIVTGSSAASVQVTFYDGDPAKGGMVFGYLSIPHIDANSNYWARSYYDAPSCGPHTIFAVAQTGSGQSSASVKASVSIAPIPVIQTISKDLHNGSQSGAGMPRITWYLDLASYFFNNNNDAAGVLMMKSFVGAVANERGGSLTPDSADKLTGLAQQLVGCVAGSGNAGKQISEPALKSLIEKSGIPEPK